MGILARVMLVATEIHQHQSGGTEEEFLRPRGDEGRVETDRIIREHAFDMGEDPRRK